ncbi:unnamed protein product [Closterium sp. Yama58-4]|nr:unnamed protein product [Closterium sp. Yama58-4]
MDVLWADPAVVGGDARAGSGREGGEYDEDDEEQEVPALERLEAVSRHSTPTRFSLTASPEVTGAGRERSAEGIPRPRTGGHGARGMHDGAQAQRGDGAVKVHPRTRALRASHHRRWASFDGSNALNWDGEDISRAHSAENSARLPWGGAAEQQLPSSLLPDSLLRESSASAVGAGCPKPSVRRTRTRQQRQPRPNASSQLQMRSRTDRLDGSGNQSDGEVDGGGALAGEGSSDDDELFRPTPRRVLGGVGARSGKWASASSGERGSVLAAWQQRELAQVEEKLRHAGDGGEMAGGALAGESQGRGMDGLGDERRRDGALASEIMTRGLSDDADVDAREDGSCRKGEAGRRRGEQGKEGGDGEGGEGREEGDDVGRREAGGEGLMEGAAGQQDAEAETQVGEDAEGEVGAGDRGEADGDDFEGGGKVDGAEGEGESEARAAEEHKAEEGEVHEQGGQGEGGHGEGGWPKFLRRNATAHAGGSKGESGGGGGSRLGQLLRNGTFKRPQGEGEERHGSRLGRVATAVRAGLKSSEARGKGMGLGGGGQVRGGMWGMEHGEGTTDVAMHAAISTAMHGAISTAMHAAISTAMHGAISTAMHAAISTAMHAAISTAMHGAISTAMHAAISTGMHAAISTAMHAAISTAMHAAISTAMHAAVATAARAVVACAPHAHHRNRPCPPTQHMPLPKETHVPSPPILNPAPPIRPPAPPPPLHPLPYALPCAFPSPPLPPPRPPLHPLFPARQFATDGFARENVLGEGGFGTVYRGLLPVAPREEVAVKVLKQLGVQADEEFHIELELLSRLDHKNLVRLHGFCSTASQRMLVYEYLPNGSLTDHLHGPPGAPELSWERRVRIAAGAARGLAHLHRQRPQILHRDVKAPNILLTSNFTAKVADFGCAKLIRRTEVVEDAVTGRQVERLCDSVDYAMGTPGHMAPEMLMTGEISAATDVYSFGVVLLQLVTGRLPIDANRQQLTLWAPPLLEEERWEELVDPRLQRALLGRAAGGGAGGGRGGDDAAGAGAAGELRRVVAGRSVGRCLQLAGTCLDMDPLQRPSMEDVALSLLAIYSSACAERDEALQLANDGFRSGRMLPPAGPSDPTRAGSGGSGMQGAGGGGSGAVAGGSARLAASGGLSESPERPAGTAKARFQRNRSARHTSFG